MIFRTCYSFTNIMFKVFHALCHILVTIKDPKYESFQSVIDTYLQDHFAAALVYKVSDIVGNIVIMTLSPRV